MRRFSVSLSRDSLTPDLLVRVMRRDYDNGDDEDTLHVSASIVEIPDFIHFLPAADQKEFWRWIQTLDTHLDLKFNVFQDKLEKLDESAAP